MAPQPNGHLNAMTTTHNEARKAGQLLAALPVRPHVRDLARSLAERRGVTVQELVEDLIVSQQTEGGT